jgi:hypothetical protein
VEVVVPSIVGAFAPLDVHKLEKMMTMKNALLAFLAGALISLALSFAADAQTVPGVTPNIVGVCGVQVNQCDPGTLGDNSPQYSPFTGDVVSYHWRCDGSPNTADNRSTLCFASAPPPQPAVATSLLGAYDFFIAGGHIITMKDGSVRPFRPTNLPIDIKQGNSDNGNESYNGSAFDFPGSFVYVYDRMPVVAGQARPIGVNVNFFDAVFGDDGDQYQLEVSITLQTSDYGWGTMKGTVRRTSSTPPMWDEEISGFVYMSRQGTSKGIPGLGAGK